MTSIDDALIQSANDWAQAAKDHRRLLIGYAGMAVATGIFAVIACVMNAMLLWPLGAGAACGWFIAKTTAARQYELRAHQQVRRLRALARSQEDLP